jgi:hypothetical protein
LPWIESRKNLQLGELVEVPGWHRHPLSGTPQPMWWCPPGLGREQLLERWYRSVWCTPPGVGRCTAMGTAALVRCHYPFPLESNLSWASHHHGDGDGLPHIRDLPPPRCTKHRRFIMQEGQDTKFQRGLVKPLVEPNHL